MVSGEDQSPLVYPGRRLVLDTGRTLQVVAWENTMGRGVLWLVGNWGWRHQAHKHR